MHFSLNLPVIYDTITESGSYNFFSPNFKTLDIDIIYCFKEPKFNKDIDYDSENCIFNQLSATGEIYDFVFKFSRNNKKI